MDQLVSETIEFFRVCGDGHISKLKTFERKNRVVPRVPKLHVAQRQTQRPQSPRHIRNPASAIRHPKR
jgi:hypothetical protein